MHSPSHSRCPARSWGWFLRRSTAIAISIAAPAVSAATPIDPHPLPPTIHTTLYGGEGSSNAVTIQRMTGFGSLLYVALTDSPGHERLDVWEVSHPTRPTLLSSLDFGSVLTNGVMFTPLALVPFDGGLLLQTRLGLTTYRLEDSGALAIDRSLPDLSTGLGLGMTQLHWNARHGSLRQQIVPNAQITGDPRQAVHRQVLVDLSTPREPRLLWAGSRGPALLDDAPVTQSIGGHPASFEAMPDGVHVRLRVFEPQRHHLRRTFWTPKIERIIAADALRTPLRELVARTLSHDSLVQWQARGLEAYRLAPGRTDTPWADLILELHAPQTSLVDVLSAYGIGLDLPVETALAGLLTAHLSPDEEARLSAEWYAPALQRWLETLLPTEMRRATSAETRVAITTAFNAGLNESTVVRYLTLEVIAPLLGNPEFMQWSLRDLIRTIVDSEPGRLVNVLLQTCGGFGAVNGILDRLRDLLDWIPGLRLPACARYPESFQDLLHLALFSWNGNTADQRLELDGLAWFELLKFHRYLSGQMGFQAYQREILQELASMQEQLATRFAARLGPALALDIPDLPLQEAHASVARHLPSGTLFGRLVAQGFLTLLPPALGIEGSTTVRQALVQLGLPVDALGRPTGSMGDLVTALRTLPMPEATAGSVLLASGRLPTDTFHAHLEQILRREVQGALHLSDLDLTLEDLLSPALDFDVDLSGILGDSMDRLVGGILVSGPAAPEQFIRLRRAFQNQDCVAQWLVTLDAVSAATAWAGMAEVPLALEYALSEAYSTGARHLVHAMFGGLISEIVDQFSGNEPLWLASQLRMQERIWSPLTHTSGVSSTILGTFTWQNRAASIVQHRFETNWFGPRELVLVLEHPDAPVATREIHDLGRWSSVHQVLHHAGTLYLGGQHFAPGDSTFPSGHGMLIDLDSDSPRTQHWTTTAPLQFATATSMTSFNRGTCLALSGVDRVFLLPNPAGAAPAHLDQTRPPRIVRGPFPDETDPADLRLKIHAIGSGPLQYEWRRNGSPFSSASHPSVSAPIGEAVADDFVEVIVRNAAGEARVGARLSEWLGVVPRIVRGPTPTTVLAGQPATLSVAVQGLSQPTFQWFLNSHPIQNASQDTLVLPSVGATHTGSYSVEVSDRTTRLRSSGAPLTVLPRRDPALIREPPRRISSMIDAAAALSVQAVGWGDLRYQWSRNDIDLPGKQSSDLSLLPVGADSGGVYRVAITDAGGQSMSAAFTVSVVSPARLEWFADSPGVQRLRLSHGTPRTAYCLERSQDLTDWVPVHNMTSSDFGTAEIPTDATSPAGIGTFFFRVRTR